MFIILSEYHYVDNIIREHTENWTFLSLTEQVTVYIMVVCMIVACQID